jgi:ankyrin repeat protein
MIKSTNFQHIVPQSLVTILQLVMIMKDEKKAKAKQRLIEEMAKLPNDFDYNIKFIITEQPNIKLEVAGHGQKAGENQEIMSLGKIILSKIDEDQDSEFYKLLIKHEFKWIIDLVARQEIDTIRTRYLFSDQPNLSPAKIIQHLLKHLENPSLIEIAIDVKSFTALHLILSKKGYLERALSKSEYFKIVKTIIEKADQDTLTKEIYNTLTFLRIAILSSSEEIVDLIIEKIGKEALNQRNSEGFTPFNTAIEMGKLAIINHLLEKYDVDLTILQGNNYTSLHAAILENFVDISELLIKKADKYALNAQSSCGATSLHIAAEQRNLRITECLLARNDIDLSIKSRDGETALHIAADKGFTEIFNLLIKKADRDILDIKDNHGHTVFDIAVALGHLEIVRAIIQKTGNAILFNINDQGLMPLYVAAENGCLDIIKFFIQEGADFNSCDSQGLTPLCAALKNGHIEVAKYLIGRLNKESKGIFDALCTAVLNDHIEIVKRLITLNSELLNERHLVQNATILHIAARQDNKEIIEFLLKKELDINEMTSDKNTALHIAATEGNINTVKTLLKNKAKLDIKNASGVTAFAMAVLYGDNKELIKVFLNHQANIGDLVVIGLTPPDFSDKKIRGWGMSIDKKIPLLLKQHWIRNQKPLEHKKDEQIGIKSIKCQIDNLIKAFEDLLPTEQKASNSIDNYQSQTIELISKYRDLINDDRDPLSKEFLSIITKLNNILVKPELTAEQKSQELAVAFFKLIKGKFINLIKEKIKNISSDKKPDEQTANKEEIAINRQIIINITNFLRAFNILILKQLIMFLRHLNQPLLQEGYRPSTKELEELRASISILAQYSEEQYMLRTITDKSSVIPNPSEPKIDKISVDTPSANPKSPTQIISSVTEADKQSIIKILRSVEPFDKKTLKIKDNENHARQVEDPHINNKELKGILISDYCTQLGELQSVFGNQLPQELTQFLLNVIVELINDPRNQLTKKIDTKQAGSHHIELFVPKIFPCKGSPLCRREKDGHIEVFKKIVTTIIQGMESSHGVCVQ